MCVRTHVGCEKFIFLIFGERGEGQFGNFRELLAAIAEWVGAPASRFLFVVFAEGFVVGVVAVVGIQSEVDEAEGGDGASAEGLVFGEDAGW